MIFTNIKKAKTFFVDDFGQSGAGKVVDFISRGRKKIYWTNPDEIQIKGIATMTVNGDSLIDVGINDGDELIIQTRFERSEIKNGKLVIAQLPCTGNVVKFFYRFDGKIVLRSANPKYEDLIYDEDLVVIKAIVLKSSKTW
ncbi:MAG TPA: S24 family peptidase [Pyrinomonadaceae bacterium]|nr:S24 family peptidase [Pyrinomonadaceae bacterium]